METLTVLVTGSSRGIGRATALALSKAGYTVVAHGRTMSAALTETLAELQAIRPDCRAVTFDVADREAARTALENDVAAFGVYYGLVLQRRSAPRHADGASP